MATDPDYNDFFVKDHANNNFLLIHDFIKEMKLETSNASQLVPGLQVDFTVQITFEMNLSATYCATLKIMLRLLVWNTAD